MNDSPLSPEAVAQMVADRDDVFLIMKRDLYYRPNAQGYTGIKDHAGRYTLEQVAAMFPNMDSPHQDGTEFIRECDAQEYTKACYHDLKEAHQAQQLTTLAAENASLRAEQAMLKFDIDKMLTQIEEHNAAWDELRASEAAALERVTRLESDNERLRYVIVGCKSAIDTGRNEPLRIWRDQIEIALTPTADKEPKT